jgi:hypothetical protein
MRRLDFTRLTQCGRAIRDLSTPLGSMRESSIMRNTVTSTDDLRSISEVKMSIVLKGMA